MAAPQGASACAYFHFGGIGDAALPSLRTFNHQQEPPYAIHNPNHTAVAAGETNPASPAETISGQQEGAAAFASATKTRATGKSYR